MKLQQSSAAGAQQPSPGREPWVREWKKRSPLPHPWPALVLRGLGWGRGGTSAASAATATFSRTTTHRLSGGGRLVFTVRFLEWSSRTPSTSARSHQRASRGEGPCACSLYYFLECHSPSVAVPTAWRFS